MFFNFCRTYMWFRFYRTCYYVIGNLWVNFCPLKSSPEPALFLRSSANQWVYNTIILCFRIVSFIVKIQKKKEKNMWNSQEKWTGVYKTIESVVLHWAFGVRVTQDKITNHRLSSEHLSAAGVQRSGSSDSPKHPGVTSQPPPGMTPSNSSSSLLTPNNCSTNSLESLNHGDSMSAITSTYCRVLILICQLLLDSCDYSVLFLNVCEYT